MKQQMKNELIWTGVSLLVAVAVSLRFLKQMKLPFDFGSGVFWSVFLNITLTGFVFLTMGRHLTTGILLLAKQNTVAAVSIAISNSLVLVGLAPVLVQYLRPPDIVVGGVRMQTEGFKSQPMDSLTTIELLFIFILLLFIESGSFWFIYKAFKNRKHTA
ncbi:MAG: hypothetical protein MUD08_01725 [Cytophagales bacterium]|jgi:hypothetical protein|nr:hypothetical protein [Cytophagales bacterium]